MRRTRVPAIVWIIAIVTVVFLALPVAGLLWKAPWSDLGEELGSTEVTTALRLSLVCSLSAALLSIVFGLPLAWVLARAEFRGRRIVRALVMLPIVLPPVVGGLALLLALGRNGIVGEWLDDWVGVSLPFSTSGVIVAETFVAMPFLIITAEAAMRTMDRRYEDVAATLGASRWTTFRRVTLPLIGKGLGAGVVLAWARALGEFGATITFAGNSPGRTQTMPLAVFIALQRRPGAAILLSLVLLSVALAILIALRDRWMVNL